MVASCCVTSRLGSCARVRLPVWVAGLGPHEPRDLLRVLLRALVRERLRGLLRLVRAPGAGNGGVEAFSLPSTGVRGVSRDITHRGNPATNQDCKSFSYKSSMFNHFLRGS